MTVRGRLAPSPTGWAHLGNAWAFLMAWLAVRSQNGELVLRMEDLDSERSSVVYMQMLMSDIRWLGLDWDEGPAPEQERWDYHQSNRTRLYAEALEQLRAMGRAYPCFCSRRDLRLASAPHLGDAGPAYPGTCRNLSGEEVQARLAKGERCAWRFRSDGRAYAFTALVMGSCSFTLEACGGDFSMRRPDGVFSYQLAVSVDDARMGISQVVRGRDILTSTPRQLAILDTLGLKAPHYAHIPLLLGEDGERLAKRHASLSLDALRTRGVRPWRVTGLLAHIAGLIDRREEIHPQELLQLFDIGRIPCHDYVITSADLCWLEDKEDHGYGQDHQ